MVFVIAFAISVWLERPVNNRTPSNERRLEQGENNPPLKRLGSEWPLPSGTPIWFHPDHSSYGTVREIDGDSAFVTFNAGLSQWVQRKHLQNVWIPSSEGNSKPKISTDKDDPKSFDVD
jgi:hypothetical protein